MQHLRNAIAKHCHLSCSSPRILEFSAAGRSLEAWRRHFCASSTSEDFTSRVLEVVKKFDRVDATKNSMPMQLVGMGLQFRLRRKHRVTEKADFRKDLNLDSLDRVELVMAIEQEFSVEIPDEKADKLACCAAVVKYIYETRSMEKDSS